MERAEFEEFVVRHQAAICGMAYSVLRDRSRSEEIAQQALLIAWRDRGAQRVSASWVCAIARNLARNAARRRTEMAMPDQEPAANQSATDEVLATREQLAHAEAALARLPERYRDALAIYCTCDESYAAVATALAISEPAARQRVHRAREQLRASLAGVERALRAARPGPAFTAAVIAAWLAGKVPSASAASLARPAATPLLSGVVIAMLASGSAALIAIATPSPSASGARSASVMSASGPSTAPTPGAMGAGAMSASPAIRSSTTASSPPTSTRAAAYSAPQVPRIPEDVLQRPMLDMDFAAAPLGGLAQIVADTIEHPVWVRIDPATQITIRVTETAAIDVLDEIVKQAGAQRREVTGVRLVERGTQGAASLGGEPMSLSVTDEPIANVLEQITPRLGMPIAGPLGRDAPHVTLTVDHVPAGAVLDQVLVQTHLGYELTSGFVIEDAVP